MSQTDQLVSKAIELQQNTLENGQRAMEQAVELPLQQSVALQRNAAQLVLDGLEIGNWLGTQGVEFTRDALDSYLDTVENAARDTSELTERGIQSAEMAGQRGLESTQQFASGFAGDGQTETQTGRLEAEAPPGYRTPAQAVAGLTQQETPMAEPPATDGQQMGYAAPAAQPQGAPVQSPQPRQRQAQAIPSQATSSPQAPPRQPPQGASMQTPPRQLTSQAPPRQQIPAQQTPPSQPPSGQIPAQEIPAQEIPAQEIPTQRGPAAPQPRGPTRIEQQAQRSRTPSTTGQAPTSDAPVAEGATGRPAPDSQRPSRQPVAPGEGEREAETPADSA
jgi:hypothetical protein